MESVVDAYPLNAAHRGILFHSLQAETVDVYLSVISVRIQGKLDQTLLQQAWQHVFTHHTSLRSGVVFDGLDEPLWVVHESINPDWEFLDFTALSASQCEIRLKAVSGQLEQVKFDFASEALMAFTLIALDDNTHRLLWTIHHIISDGWSTAVILEDLATAYSACARGEVPALPPALAYSQFINAQSNLDLAPLKSYWSDYLSDREPTALQFGELLRDPCQVKQRAIKTQVQLGAKRSQAIAAAARRLETTSNVLLLGAWGFVLRDFCQHESPLFGVTLAGRPANLPSIERGVGLYAATLPLCIDTAGSTTIKDWLNQIGKTLQAHAQHEALAIVDIQKLLEREANEPLFSSVVALAGHVSDLSFGSINQHDIQIDSVEYQIRSHFDMSLLVSQGETISLNLISQTRKLDEVLNQLILDRYIALLDVMVSAECDSVSALRNSQVQGASGNPAVTPGHVQSKPLSYQSIDEWIFGVAEQKPSSMALVQGNRRLTYAELKRKAGQVSRALNCKVDDYHRPIAISLSNGVDAIVAMLGILHSGRCYIPIDTQQPVERQAQLCADADCALIIKQCSSDADINSMNESGGSEGNDTPIIVTLPSLLQEGLNETVTREPRTGNTQSLAYLMYTSGSTGKPKGVPISHANLIYSTQARFDYYPDAVKQFLLVSPLHFDSSVVGIYWTLCSGGTIVLPDEENRKELAHWSELVSTHHITHVLCLPSLYRLWLQQGTASSLQSLDTVIVAGESCEADICAAHYQKLPDTVLYNEYGPTEACVWSSVHRCRAQEAAAVPIGKPIAGTTINVVGLDGSVCPDGVEGELQLISEGVADGYHKQPDLSAGVFTSNPRGYKTGDLGYRSRSGELFCTGRVDRQIKIRGQRIEPAEVELVARQVEGVIDARAFSNTRGSGDSQRLWLAYTPQDISSDSIASALQARLPASMWPHGYLALDNLPTLSNGKVSESRLVQLLPETDSQPLEPQDESTKSETDIELLAMVNGLLGEDKATMTNNAVACGLDSIDAMKLTAQLRERFDIDLRLVNVLESRHWAELATRISTLLNANASANANANANAIANDNDNDNTDSINADTSSSLNKSSDNSSSASLAHPDSATSAESASAEHGLGLSAQQLPLWYLDQTGMPPAVYAIHSTLRCKGRLVLSAIEFGLNALVHQNEILRTRLQLNESGEVCQVVMPAEPVELSVIDESSAHQSWEDARDAQLSQHFNLADDQLLRSLVFRLSDKDCFLMFHSHHIAMDGWSFGLLREQFADHYRRYCNAMTRHDGKVANDVDLALPPPAECQYHHYTQWQQTKEIQSHQADIAHWCQVLEEPRESLSLPVDFTRPTRPSYQGGSVVQSIQAHITQQWADVAQTTQSTPFMVALAAVKSSLRRVLGASDLLIGTPVSNRVEPRWQSMLGFFGNTVVIRTRSTESNTFMDSVQQTRAATLEALQHESVPFDQVVRALGLQGSTNRHPLFDVFFIYQHQHESVTDLPDVEVNLVPQTALDTAKFDLAIEIRPDSNNEEYGYELHLNYSTDLFHTATIEQLAADLLSAMSLMARHTTQPISGHLQSAQSAKIATDCGPVAGNAQSQRSENQCEATKAAPPNNHALIIESGLLVDQRIDHVFHTTCVSNPDAIALRHNDHLVNYGQLDQVVDRIAHGLRESGVQPGEVVIVSLPRSAHQIAAALAVSRCGGVWCPVDPAYPESRKHYVYTDSGSRFLIAGPDAFMDKAPNTPLLHIVVDCREPLNKLIPRPVTTLDSGLPEVDATSAKFRAQTGAAVLMYTSGSEGNPKGVLLGHLALMNRMVWMWNRYPFDDDDVNVIKTSCSFVDSLWENFGALLAGVPSVIINDAHVTDIEQFLEKLRSNKVTRVLLVPSLLSTMLDWLKSQNETLPHLKLCSCSGEVLPANLAQRFLSWQSQTRLLNLYGSTEVAADVTCQEIVGSEHIKNLPLGTAIDGNCIHILDDKHRPIPPGGSGEIALSGTGLAIGYHNDVALNAQKFVELDGIGRVLLSGDTGHIDSLGRLHFEGRKDRQVKVRGVRVNCHEIEQQINAAPGIGNSLVFAIGELDERQLCAVVQRQGDNEITKPIDRIGLSEYLKTRLPVHQLPDQYRLVDALPELPNGKPDRRAAAALMQESVRASHLLYEPVTEDESRHMKSSMHTSLPGMRGSDKHLLEPMLAVWKDTLKNDQITADDDFFDVGGYSLLAVKLVMRVNKDILKQHQLQMTIGDLLEYRTVAQVVQQLQKNTPHAANKLAAHTESLMTLQAGSGVGQLFMVPPFGDTGFFFRKFASHVPKQISVYSFDMAISLEHESVQSLSASLVDELLAVQPSGPWVIVAGCLGNILAFEMAQQLKARTGCESDLYLIDSNPPREGPGWKHVKERRTGLNHYWAILRTEFKEDHCRGFIRLKVRQFRAKFDVGIRKYLDVRVKQSNQFVAYQAHAGSADITLFRSSTFMRKAFVAERWALLTNGKFTLHDFPKIDHEALLLAESPHWSLIAPVVLESHCLKSEYDGALLADAENKSTVPIRSSVVARNNDDITKSSH